jgi:hypothetical protein
MELKIVKRPMQDMFTKPEDLEHIEVKPSFFGISINLSSLINSLINKK